MHFAVQTDRIVGIHAVFGNQNRRMIALIEEARPPVQPVFIDGPFQGVMRMTRRVAHMLRLAVRPPAPPLPLIDVLPIEVQRLMDGLQVLLPAVGKVLLVADQPIRRVLPQHHRVREPRNIPRRPDFLVNMDGKILLAGGGDVLWRIRIRHARVAAGGIADANAGNVRPKHLNRTAVRQHQVMRRANDVRRAAFQPRRVDAQRIP